MSGKVSPPALPALTAIGPRLRGYVLEQLRGAAGALVDADTHDGIHACRKGIRRARAVLALALGTGTFGERGRRVDRDLRALGRGLSRLRDAHVVAQLLADGEPVFPPSLASALPHLLPQAQRRRDQRLEEAFARDPAFARRRTRLEALARRVERLDWAGVDESQVDDAVARCARRAKKAERRALAHPKRDAAWHGYRRRTRRLRQLDAALADIDPARRPPHRDLHELANALGQAQDAALLLAVCGARSPLPAQARRELRVVARERLRLARRTVHAIAAAGRS